MSGIWEANDDDDDGRGGKINPDCIESRYFGTTIIASLL